MRHRSIQTAEIEEIEYFSNPLDGLVDMEDPQSVRDEVRAIFFMAIPGFDFKPVDMVFRDMVKLFSGKYPGYKGCNTKYHDLKHTTDTFLAMARLIHGALVKGLDIDNKAVTQGLISTLMHDTGYIQHIDDNKGTGAKYTLVHIERSIEFIPWL